MMEQDDLKKDDQRTGPPRSDKNANLTPVPARDLIEPDPKNPLEVPPADIEPGPLKRPDLDWAEHED